MADGQARRPWFLRLSEKGEAPRHAVQLLFAGTLSSQLLLEPEPHVGFPPLRGRWVTPHGRCSEGRL